MTKSICANNWSSALHRARSGSANFGRLARPVGLCGATGFRQQGRVASSYQGPRDDHKSWQMARPHRGNEADVLSSDLRHGRTAGRFRARDHECVDHGRVPARWEGNRHRQKSASKSHSSWPPFGHSCDRFAPSTVLRPPMMCIPSSAIPVISDRANISVANGRCRENRMFLRSAKTVESNCCFASAIA
jgi:hypothetical protein